MVLLLGNYIVKSSSRIFNSVSYTVIALISDIKLLKCFFLLDMDYTDTFKYLSDINFH